MKLVYVIHSLPEYKEKLYQALTSEIDIVFITNGLNELNQIVAENVKISPTFKIGRFYFQYRLLYDVLKLNPDRIILAWNLNYPFRILIAIVFRLLGLKFFWWGHIVGRYSNSLASVLRRVFLGLSNGIYVYSLATSELLKHEIKNMRIVSLNNSHISISDFVRPQLHDRNNVRTLKLCFIGRYHKRKNLERIYNFINESTIDGLHLTLVGPGMTEVFRPTEFIDVMDETIGEELDSILSQQNAIVCPGLIGLLALDAAKFGLPVLVQKGLKHGPEVHLLVESDQYFIDFEDSEVLSETLVYLKSHPQELVCKGQDLQDVAIEKYNVEHSVHVLIDSIS